METNRDLVHLAILKDAAEIANQQFALEYGSDADPARWKRGRFEKPPHERETIVYGDLFRPDPIQSEKGGLCLSIDPRIAQGMPPEQRKRVHEIGRNAIKQSLVKNRQVFIGLIIGEARAGRNYFDNFDQQDQLRFF